MTAAALASPPPTGVVRSPAGAVLACRAARLDRLRIGHPFGDFLAFVGRIVAVQTRLTRHDAPWTQQAHRIAREIAAFGGLPPETHAAAVAAAALGAHDIAGIASRWLDRTAAPADITTLPFVLAGLQLERMRATTSGALRDAVPGRCPACGGPPLVAALDASGDSAGVRHIHCALCAASWRVERLTCLACGREGSVRVLALEGDERPVKAEACDGCGRYLKTFTPAGLDGFEPLADDLATFDLDLRLADDGFSRVTANPFLMIT
jgi:FdhE protein